MVRKLAATTDHGDEAGWAITDHGDATGWAASAHARRRVRRRM